MPSKHNIVTIHDSIWFQYFTNTSSVISFGPIKRTHSVSLSLAVWYMAMIYASLEIHSSLLMHLNCLKILYHIYLIHSPSSSSSNPKYFGFNFQQNVYKLEHILVGSINQSVYYSHHFYHYLYQT